MNSQLSALVAVVVVVVVATALVLAVVLTGHTDTASLQLVTTVLGFAGTIILVLLGLTSVKAQVAEVHKTINGQLTDAVAAAAKDAAVTAVTDGLIKSGVVVAPDPLTTDTAPAPPVHGG